MNTLFTEQALMLFHSVYCEMAYADQSLAMGHTNNQPSREIILVEDDDDVMYEANNGNPESGENSQAGGGRCLNLRYSL